MPQPFLAYPKSLMNVMAIIGTQFGMKRKGKSLYENQ